MQEFDTTLRQTVVMHACVLIAVRRIVDTLYRQAACQQNKAEESLMQGITCCIKGNAICALMPQTCVVGSVAHAGLSQAGHSHEVPERFGSGTPCPGEL